MKFKLEKFKGPLLSAEYAEAVKALRSVGVVYKDAEYGWSGSYYWDKGLYRVTKRAVYPLFSFCIHRPHVCRCLSFKEMAVKLRPIM
jgi:hypothetical protein